MKKIFFIIILFTIGIGNVFASERMNVTLDSCVDGDTAKFILNQNKITARFLAIDTPESVHPTKGVEPYGKEASNFTCNKLKNASKIEIEYDDNSNEKDKYDRYLVWVWIDDYLLQDELVKEGLAEVTYLYGDYKYTPILQDHEQTAKIQKINIWNNNTISTNIYIPLFTLFLIILFCLISKKYRKKTINKVKKKVNKEINNLFK